MTDRALVLAHYHSHGALRSDTLALLAKAVECFSRVLLISTKLERAEIPKVPHGVEVHVRDNVGYDFYSYRQGILALLSDPPAARGLAEICLMNSSFLCMDAGRFLHGLLHGAEKFRDCYGLVRSFEIAEHVQSYILILKRHIFSNPAVIRWWDEMVPLNERALVITRYEIGFSQLLLELGCQLDAVYDHLATVSGDISRRSSGPEQAAALNAQLNPSHFHWLSLLRGFATLKIEVYRSNPFGLDLQPLALMAQADARVRGLLAEGLQN